MMLMLFSVGLIMELLSELFSLVLVSMLFLLLVWVVSVLMLDRGM